MLWFENAVALDKCANGVFHVAQRYELVHIRARNRGQKLKIKVANMEKRSFFCAMEEKSWANVWRL